MRTCGFEGFEEAKLRPGFIVSLLFILVLGACSGGSDGGAVIRYNVPEVTMIDGKIDPSLLAEHQILRRGNGSEPQSLDPHKAEGVPSSHILRDLFEGLTGESPEGDIIPAGAESWDISEDGLTYIFHIRKNAFWSNGDPVTAADFSYGLHRSTDPLTGSEYAQMLAPILHAEDVISGKQDVSALGVKALDEHTLEIRLKGPTPYFLGLLNHSSTYPVNQRNVEEHGNSFARPGKLVGNGAYVLKDWVVRSHITLEKSQHYWDKENVIITEVVLYPIEDQSTAVKRYRAGELDWTYELPNNQFKWLSKHMPQDLQISPYLGVYYYGFNLTQPPFKDNPKLRVALSMAIEREILTDKVTQFGESPNYAYVPTGIPGYKSKTVYWAGFSREERVKEAKKLYEEAGYSETNPLQIEIRYNTSENHKKIALAISAMWKQNLGVKTTLVNEEWKVFLENRKQKKLTQVFRAGWIGDYSDPYNFFELLHSKHGINDSGYNNPEYDALLAQISVESDLDKRGEMMHKAEAIMLQDQPVAPVYSYVTKRLVRPSLQGWKPNVMDHHYSKYMYLLKYEMTQEPAK